MPPSSLSNKYDFTVSKYFMAQAWNGRSPFMVETDFALHAERVGNFPTAIIQARMLRVLNDQDIARFRALLDMLRPLMEQVTVSQEDVDSVEPLPF